MVKVFNLNFPFNCSRRKIKNKCKPIWSPEALFKSECPNYHYSLWYGAPLRAVRTKKKGIAEWLCFVITLPYIFQGPLQCKVKHFKNPFRGKIGTRLARCWPVTAWNWFGLWPIWNGSKYRHKYFYEKLAQKRIKRPQNRPKIASKYGQNL